MISSSCLPGLVWRKSSYSGNNAGDCLEVASGLPGVVPVRDSKSPEGPVLMLSPRAWTGFVAFAAGAQR
ncbi:DUF397 domain-containing protein [Streptomyces liangshanensis]|uniref:DUF397 domain-containing protein n=1 Tax=Streptomyces liangshanensis TaxID=2717324 RepID=A0A6G9H237_9ACTN|nr:DUF397 domain-containing protein [Streptomyces liangshanensis]QIQ04281.1 DUF397 domain-containing protein [Streptomyces liangshanensis]